MAIKIEKACDFALDVQEASNGATDMVSVVKKCIEKYKNHIDPDKSDGQMIAFIDGSTATLEGHDWVLGKIE